MAATKKVTDPLTRELNTLVRRVALIRSAQAGEIQLRKITVHRQKTSWTVHARTKTYVRYIAPAGWKPKGG